MLDTSSFFVHAHPSRTQVMSIAFEKTSTLMATGASDSSIRVWDVIKGFCTHNFRGSSGVVSNLVFHPTKLELFSCADDCHIQWWSLETGKKKSTLKGHNSLVRSLAFSPDAKTMLSGGRDQIVLAWSLISKKQLATVPLLEAVESVVVLPGTHDDDDGPKEEFCYATVGSKSMLRMWGYPSGRLIRQIDCPAALMSCIIDPVDGTLILTTFEHSLLFHDQRTLERTRQIVGSYDQVLDVKFIGAAESHLAVATNTQHIQLVDARTKDAALLEGHRGIVMSLDVSLDGLTMVSGSKDNTIRVWIPDDDHIWRCAAEGVGHAGDIATVALAPKSGAYVASGSKDCTIKIWGIDALAMKSAVSAGRIIQLSSHHTRRAHLKDVNCVAFSPNDKLALSAGQDRLAKIWRVDDGEIAGTLKGHKRGVWCGTFSPVDQIVATSSGDGTVKVWALATFSCVKTFEGHGASVHKVLFLSRGMQLLSAGSDGLLKLWTIRTGEEVKTIEAHDGGIWGLGVSRDESKVVTGALDGQIVVWDDCTESDLSEKHAEEDRIIVLSQDLDNLVVAKHYEKAVSLAIELNRPFQLLKIVKAILSSTGAVGLHAIVKPLTHSELSKVLGYIRDWNTNARTVLPSQELLRTILGTFRPSELLATPDIRTTVASLLSYGDRHLGRFRLLLQSSKLIDYIWTGIKPTAHQDGKFTSNASGLTESHNHKSVEHILTIDDSLSAGDPVSIEKPHDVTGLDVTSPSNEISGLDLEKRPTAVDNDGTEQERVVCATPNNGENKTKLSSGKRKVASAETGRASSVRKRVKRTTNK